MSREERFNVRQFILLLAFMFYPNSFQVSRAALLCLSELLLLFPWKFFPQRKMHTHTHAHSHCRDVMLLGNVFKTMGKCNWFSGLVLIQRLEGVLEFHQGWPSANQHFSSPALVTSAPQWTCALWMYSRTKGRGTKACTSQPLVLLAKATKESKEPFYLKGI